MSTVHERMSPPRTGVHAGPSLARLVKVARNSMGLALLTASAAGFAQTGAAVPEAQLKACPFAKGDSITKVKAFYALQIEPTRFNSSAGLASATAYQYHLPDRGVWIFFDSSLQVASLRFEAPFAGTIGGIAPGATLEELKRVKGEPVRPAFQGFLDAEDMARRKDLPKQRVAELPEMVPKAKVADLVDEVVKLYTASPKWTQAYTYGSAQSGTFNRYDVGSNNKVQVMLSSSCAAI